MAELDANGKKRILRRLRVRLKKEKATLDAALAKARFDLKNSQKTMKPEDAPSTSKVDLIRLNKNSNSSLLRIVAELQAAIEKVKRTGKYGTCENEDCGEEISEKRLKVNPEAKFCLRCQEIREKKEREAKKVSAMSGTRTGYSGMIF